MGFQFSSKVTNFIKICVCFVTNKGSIFFLPPWLNLDLILCFEFFLSFFDDLTKQGLWGFSLALKFQFFIWICWQESVFFFLHGKAPKLDLYFCHFSLAFILLNFNFSLFIEISLQVTKDPYGKEINALEQHIKNLLCPSTPTFFNTLYDPYREGAYFVREYPFSLREGKPAVSHGLWLNIPDYDTPTQLVKPLERNTR